MAGGPGGLGEFEIVELFRALARRPWVRDAMGDDCAVLDIGGGQDLLVTTDLMAEGIHFLRDGQTFRELGAKALAVNLSDIAAMGGEPEAAFLSIALPPDLAREQLEGFRDGLRDCAAAYGVDLVGGDTSASRGGFFLSITLLGRCPGEEVVRRRGGRPGDRIYVGGGLGDSAAGLLLLQAEAKAGRSPAPGWDVQPLLRAFLLRAHRAPQPQVALGRLLARNRFPSAMIDVSDGFLQDLGHICRASGVGAEVDAGALPLSTAARSLGRRARRDPVDWALSGGEDYVLLFTVPEDRAEAMEAAVRAELRLALHPVGRLVETPGLRLKRDGAWQEVSPRGWDHFGEDDPVPRADA